jgi:large subunit ribosomal protein L24
MKKQIKTHVKVGDKVKVTTGSQKGFIGTINSIISNKSLVIIEGILPRIKYTKNRQGGDPVKKEIPMSIHISNVMLWDKEANIASKIGYKIVDNKKVRYFKKSGNLLSQK